MSVTQELHEDTVQRVAPDASALQAARGLLRKKAFLKPAVAPDGTWLFGQCQGSGKNPYEVSVNLADAGTPVGRCTCPSRKFPCKHALGLMLAYLEKPDSFAHREPPDELVAKRAKQAQRAEKATKDRAEPRKVNKSAQLKKAAAQREGLDLLEKLVLDLVNGGQWCEPAQAERLERQARQMNDHYLPGAALMLRQLVQRTEEERSDEERNEIGAQILGALWATVQRGRNYLDGKLAGEETQAEADAVIEEVLGKAWQLGELREQGYWRENLRLLELAFEVRDDQARQERVETSYLLDLDGGDICRAVAYRPFKGLRHIPEQPSYGQPLRVREAAVYPGLLSRRVRWEKGAESAEPMTPDHLRAAYALAGSDFEAALAAYRKASKNPLGSDAVGAFLVRCACVGRVGEQVVLEDAQGKRLVTGNRLPDQLNVANLERAAGSTREPAVLFRFLLNAAPTRILAYPLAVVTPGVDLRLGV